LSLRSLAAVADDGDRLGLQDLEVGVLVVVDFCAHEFSPFDLLVSRTFFIVLLFHLSIKAKNMDIVFEPPFLWRESGTGFRQIRISRLIKEMREGSACGTDALAGEGSVGDAMFIALSRSCPSHNFRLS
jgi:hypothetical protein